MGSMFHKIREVFDVLSGRHESRMTGILTGVRGAAQREADRQIETSRLIQRARGVRHATKIVKRYRRRSHVGDRALWEEMLRDLRKMDAVLSGREHLYRVAPALMTGGSVTDGID